MAVFTLTPISSVSGSVAAGTSIKFTIVEGGFTGAGGATVASGLGISPAIPGLSATNVQDGLTELADDLAPKEFSQSTPALEWIWNHNLGARPRPKVYNLAYQEIDAEVQHSSVNQLRVRVNPAMAGYIII